MIRFAIGVLLMGIGFELAPIEILNGIGSGLMPMGAYWLGMGVERYFNKKNKEA